MSIQKDLQELLKANVITQEIANSIENYYLSKAGKSSNKLIIIFGVLGALLVGLGLLLIIAHNWDELSRSTKTFLAFLPLIITQLLGVFVILRKLDSIAWKESVATLIFFSIGSSISLISQIYNIYGDLSTYILTWMLLAFPLIYVMKSSFVSLLYIIGITFYAAESGYWAPATAESYLYWLLIALAIPHYYSHFRNNPKSNFLIFHNWLIPLSVIISLGTVAESTEELMFIAYFSLFGLFLAIGEIKYFSNQKNINNGFQVLGSLGTIILLLMLSFEWFWDDLYDKSLGVNEIISSPEFYASLIISILALTLLIINTKQKSIKKISPIAPIFLLFIIFFIVGIFSPISILLVNLTVFAIGILIIFDGAKQEHFGRLNYGLLIITALIICRYFDTDLSFVFRGLLFVSVGAGFFAANYWMLRKRKKS